MSSMVRRFATAAALAAAAAAEFSLAASTAVAARGRFCVVLPGGRTPSLLYRALRAAPYAAAVPWQACRFFFSDERCVPPDHEASNFGLARRELFSPVGVSPAQIFAAPTESGTVDQVANAWEQSMRAFFGASAAWPEFDLAILGVGADGHTASLFPGSGALDVKDRWVQPVAPCGTPAVARVTLTLAALSQARAALFLAAGPDKQAVIAAVEARAAAFPADRVRPPGGTLWLYSEAGA